MCRALKLYLSFFATLGGEKVSEGVCVRVPEGHPNRIES